jgi:hypothetical protein
MEVEARTVQRPGCHVGIKSLLEQGFSILFGKQSPRIHASNPSAWGKCPFVVSLYGLQSGACLISPPGVQRCFSQLTDA